MFYTHKNGISLRKLDKSDLEKLRELKDESWFGTVNTACVNMTDQMNWFESISKDKSCLYFILRAPRPKETYETDVGLYGITDINSTNQSCSFTHSIFSDHRGLGLGNLTLQAAIDMTFEIFNIRRIETWILENNIAEQQVVKNVGFIEEGSKRKAVYKCQEYLNCNLYGLLRDEWLLTDRIKLLGNICNNSYKPKSNKP